MFSYKDFLERFKKINNQYKSNSLGLLCRVNIEGSYGGFLGLLLE